MNTSNRNGWAPVIACFEDLLEMARAEPEPCRLLTVAVRAETAFRRRASGAQAMIDEGCLAPVMMRDWPVAPGLSLASIVGAADDVTPDWRFLMVSVMPGKRGRAPSDADCDYHLERMVKALAIGEGFESSLFFDRMGAPVRITPAMH